MDGAERLDEAILGQVRRILAVADEVVDDPVNPLPVAEDKGVEGRDLPGLHAEHDLAVRVRLLPALRRGDQRLG